MGESTTTYTTTNTTFLPRTNFRGATDNDQRFRLAVAQEKLVEHMSRSDRKQEYRQEIIKLATEVEEAATRRIEGPSCTLLHLEERATMLLGAGRSRWNVGDYVKGEQLMWKAVRIARDKGLDRARRNFMYYIAHINHERIGGLLDSEMLYRKCLKESEGMSLSYFLDYHNDVLYLLVDQGKRREAWAFTVEMIYQVITRDGGLTVQMGSQILGCLSPIFCKLHLLSYFPHPPKNMMVWESEEDVKQELKLLRNELGAAMRYDPVKAVANLKKTVDILIDAVSPCPFEMLFGIVRQLLNWILLDVKADNEPVPSEYKDSVKRRLEAAWQEWERKRDEAVQELRREARREKSKKSKVSKKKKKSQKKGGSAAPARDEVVLEPAGGSGKTTMATPSGPGSLLGTKANGVSKSSEVVSYRDDDGMKVVVECAICLEVLEQEQESKEVQQLPCKHQFHFECIRLWSRKCEQKGFVFSCPYCRDETKPLAMLL